MGFHWFKYREDPKEGRGLDCENRITASCSIDFTPWEVLTARMVGINAEIEELHAK